MRVLITGETSVLIGNAIRRILKDTDLDIVVYDGVTPKDDIDIEPCQPDDNDFMEDNLEKWQSKGKRKMPKIN